jgi:hypothetical protein
MKRLIKVVLRSVFLVSFLVIVGLALFFGYPYIFSRKVIGVVTGVSNLTENVAVLAGSSNTGPQTTAKVFSFAVAVRDTKTSEIVTGSSEDRQWGVVKEGQCAQAEFFPYPPWKLDKAGTYYGVRLLKLFDSCDNLPK